MLFFFQFSLVLFLGIYFAMQSLRSILSSLKKNHPNPILTWITLNRYRNWRKWHSVALRFPTQEHGMACPFQILFFNLPEDLIPFMFLYFHFICFISINNIQYCLVFKILPVLSLTEAWRALHLSTQCDCSTAFHSKNCPLFIYPVPSRWAISLHPKFLLNLFLSFSFFIF